MVEVVLSLLVVVVMVLAPVVIVAGVGLGVLGVRVDVEVGVGVTTMMFVPDREKLSGSELGLRLEEVKWGRIVFVFTRLTLRVLARVAVGVG